MSKRYEVTAIVAEEDLRHVLTGLAVNGFGPAVGEIDLDADEDYAADEGAADGDCWLPESHEGYSPDDELRVVGEDRRHLLTYCGLEDSCVEKLGMAGWRVDAAFDALLERGYMGFQGLDVARGLAGYRASAAARSAFGKLGDNAIRALDEGRWK